MTENENKIIERKKWLETLKLIFGNKKKVKVDQKTIDKLSIQVDKLSHSVEGLIDHCETKTGLK